MLAVFLIVFATTDTAYCKALVSRIGRFENPSCSSCGHLSSHSALSSYGLLALLALKRLSVSLRPLVQALGSCPASGVPWSSALFPSLGRDRVATTTKVESTKLPESAMGIRENGHAGKLLRCSRKTLVRKQVSVVIDKRGMSMSELAKTHN